MASVEEGTHKADDGFELYTKTWKPAETQARVLFVHGFSDHCNNYEDFFAYLVTRGIEIHAFDQRGWGRSVQMRSQRGLTGPTRTVLADITSMLNTLLPSPDHVPVFLMGHSMGGAEVLTYGAQGPPALLAQVRGMLALAPLVALHPSTRPWRATVVAGKLAAKLLPRRQLVSALDSKWLSHDSARNAAWEQDALNHDTGTLEGLAGMLGRAQDLERGDVRVREGVNEGGVTRLVVFHGTDDHINLFDASRGFVEACEVRDKEIRPYEGWYHNLHAEPDPDENRFGKDVAGWILDRLDGGAKMSSGGAPSQAKL